MKNRTIGYILVISILSHFISLLNAQVNTESLRKEGLENGLYSQVNADFGYHSGNSEYLTIKSGLRVDFVYKQASSFFVLNYKRRSLANEVYTNQGFIHLRNMIEISPKFSGELFWQKQFNDFIKLKDRNLLGGGIRIKPIEKKTSGGKTLFRIYLGVGLMFENEVLEKSITTETNILRSTNYLSILWNLNERVLFNTIAYYQASLEDIADFRAIVNSTFLFTLSQKISLKTAFELNYDSQPPNTISKHDLEITNGIRFSF